MEPLSARKRFGAALATWATLYLASPGVASDDGWGVLALFALVPWAAVAERPGKRAFLAEWLAASLGCAALVWWIAIVFVPILAFVGVAMALYYAGAGALLRRTRRAWPRLPLAVLAPSAWLCAETLLAVLPCPPGFSWQRIGHCFHDLPALAGSARLWGVGGLSWTALALAGWLAEVLPRAWGSRREPLPAGWKVTTAAGLGPLVLALAVSGLLPPPETRPGPRVLLVQPSFAQARKQEQGSLRAFYEDQVAATRDGLRRAAERGEPPPDLVAWGETMLRVPILEEGVAEAVREGKSLPPWRGELTEEEVELFAEWERDWVVRNLLGHANGRRVPAVLPQGTSFLSGAELLVAGETALERRNGVVLWDAEGKRGPAGFKQHLVPAAETMLGFERFEGVRRVIDRIAGYVPDLEMGNETTVLTLRARDGESYSLAVTVCYDNAYIGPYAEPARRGELDFHLVVSNEAWYLDSPEMDQMVAFSRLIAIATGRAVVRSTNAGITVVLGPDGRELGRIDPFVPGALSAVVPVPTEPDSRPPFVLLREAWWTLWLGAGPGLLLAARLFRGYRRGPSR